MAELQDYSTTAASNNSASPAGWPEGMAPSGVNDSDRELAARVARERDDTQGVTAAGGTANALTFAAARDTAAAYTGESITFRASATNTAAATINITPSGGAARGTVAIQTDARALAGGEIRSGGVYTVVYDGTQYQLLNPSTGWQLIQSQDASASATLDFTSGINSTYDLYALVFSDVLPATDNVQPYLRVQEAAAFQADASDYEYAYESVGSATYVGGVTASQAAAHMQMSQSCGNVAGEGINGIIYFHNPDLTSTNAKAFNGNITHWDNTATAIFVHSDFVGAYNGASGAVTGVRFLFSSGNIASGTIALYALRK